MRKIPAILAAALLAVACATPELQTSDKLPAIWPDYVGVTVPAQIAPLNFCLVDRTVRNVDVLVTNSSGGQVRASGRNLAQFPEKAWHRLLEDSVGDSLKVHVDGYKPFYIYVSKDEIDYGLTYRLIPPGYHNYGKMGIYERRLSDFRQSAVIENTQFDGCVNCHSFNQCNPDDLSLHIRGAHGATLLRKDGTVTALETRTDSTLAACVYPYWHPGGDYVAYSTNSTMQTFHVGSGKLIEVFDADSDLQILDLRNNVLLTADSIKNPGMWETFPAFSPDGRWLYFCSAEPRNVPRDARNVRYNLCRVSFDPASGRIGDEIQTLVNARASGKSVSFPRPSFDGRFLMFTLSDYGNFSVWHPESDLWLLDLQSGRTRPLIRANSKYADSYHNWSSNSRWFVFGTRRDDQSTTRPYICHIDENGRESKPFLLPQKDPYVYYREEMNSYNIPEFVKGPVNLDRNKVERMIAGKERKSIGYRGQH